MKRINKVSGLLFLALALGMLTAPWAQAAFVSYTDRSTWLTALGGPPSFTEDFSSFGVDTEFRTATVNVNNNFTLRQATGARNFRNIIDVSPFLFLDNNGTTHASMFTEFDEPVKVSMGFFSPFYAWGGDFYKAADGELLNLEFAGNTIPMGVNTGFFGFIADAPGTELLFVSRASDPGEGGEGFGLDNVSAGVSAVPLPGALWLLGSGLLGLAGLRGRFRS